MHLRLYPTSLLEGSEIVNEEIKRRWIAKLESGGYAQTANKLADDSGYCCLGVLCEVAVEDGVVFKTIPGDGERFWYTSKLDSGDSEGAVLPEAVVKWAGLKDTNPDVSYIDADGVEDNATLAELNDNGHTFLEIAQLVEQSL